MPQVLEQMLGELPLRLVSLRKLPPQIEIDSQIDGVPRVYRHGLRIELVGSYQNTLDYLGRLEALPWRLAWEALDIQVRDYPKTSVILTLYTLSFEEGWLGV
jgi:MSHA biogenesis protein MshJ